MKKLFLYFKSTQIIILIDKNSIKMSKYDYIIFLEINWNLNEWLKQKLKDENRWRE